MFFCAVFANRREIAQKGLRVLIIFLLFFGRQMTRNIIMLSVIFVVHLWYAHVSARMLAISFILTFSGLGHEAEILIQIR